jgi:hypothetical protein
MTHTCKDGTQQAGEKYACQVCNPREVVEKIEGNRRITFAWYPATKTASLISEEVIAIETKK